MVQIQIKALPGAELPSYATAGSAGADLRAYLPESGSLVLPAGASAMVSTGLHLALPSGYEGQVRPRSGLAAKYGVTVLNAPGTIDSDYRGEVRVILINHGDSDYRLAHGERIAQLVIAQVEQCRFTAAERIDDTDRGAGGFGSTGM